MRDFIGRYRCIHSKIYYYHTLAEAKEKIIVELYLLPDFPPVSGEGGSRIEDSAVVKYPILQLFPIFTTSFCSTCSISLQGTA
jgi:hypothetical protein